MQSNLWLKYLAVALILGAGLLACSPDTGSGNGGGGSGDVDTDVDGDTDTDADSDTDADADSDWNLDGGGDADSDGDGGPILPDCKNCAAVGSSLENMRCAVDLCDDAVFLNQQFTSPTNAKTQGAYAAVARFGASSNDLAPLLNGSYALMASGTATGSSHSVAMGGNGQQDPFPNDKTRTTYDVMEWKLHLKAPKGAHGFQIYYVFLSEEYDEYVGSVYNDKFYIFLEAKSTNNGQKSVINFTKCRSASYAGDKTCDKQLADMGLCAQGDKLCYIAINTALSECCWYQSCPNGKWTTDISGTGFTCAASRLADSAARGSSTGWLKTEWPVDPEEEFDVTFHVHDTSDHILDSEVIIDKFLFVGKAEPGTVPIN